MRCDTCFQRVAVGGFAALFGLVVTCTTALAQGTGTIAGTVEDRQNGQPIPGAAVVVDGTDVTTVANGVGRFEIGNVPAGQRTLLISAPGYLEFRVPNVIVSAGQTAVLAAELELTPNFMELVQVTATKSALSIGEVAAQATIVEREDIERKGDQTLTQAIGNTPGVFVSTQLGIFESVLMRGLPRQGNEFTNTLLLIDGVPQTNSGNDARVVALPINDASSVYYQEARIEFDGTTGSVTHGMTVGGSYEPNEGQIASDFIFNDPDLFGFAIDYLNPVIPDRNEWQHFEGSRVYNLGISALFGQYMLEPAPRLLLTAGGRYDRLAMDVTRAGASLVAETFDAFSPKVSATVKLMDTGSAGPALNAYGAYSQSFLPPRRPSSLTPADVDLNLEPEDIANYEAGLKGSFLDNRLSVDAAVFRMIEDGVVLSRRVGPFFLPTNAGRRNYKGVETGVAMAFTPGVSAYVNSSIYRHRFGDFVIQSDDGDTALTSNRLRMSPDYIVNWGLSVTLIPNVDASVDVKHVSDVQGNDDNSFGLSSYTVVDAAVSVGRGPLRITLAAHNVLNEEYYWNGDGESADPASPRQVLVTTSVRFR
jgi:outer membrane receptor protein involved in Fe transport